jgi:GDP-L-fucose synthase
MKEVYLLTGEIEPTNEPYAIAKIAEVKLCDAYRFDYGCNFISVMPTSLYGPNDNYDLKDSHVLPALLRKFVTARNDKIDSIILWESGNAKREFLHADDLANALLFLMHQYSEPGVINIGVGEDISVLHLAKLVQKGNIITDSTKPDGAPEKRKGMDVINASEILLT